MKCARGAALANLLNTGRGTFSLSRPAMRSFPRKLLTISMKASLGSISLKASQHFDPYQYYLLHFLLDVFSDPCLSPFECDTCVGTHPSGDRVLWTSLSQCVLCREGWGWMENLNMSFFSFLRIPIPQWTHIIFFLIIGFFFFSGACG